MSSFCSLYMQRAIVCVVSISDKALPISELSEEITYFVWIRRYR